MGEEITLEKIIKKQISEQNQRTSEILPSSPITPRTPRTPFSIYNINTPPRNVEFSPTPEKNIIRKIKEKFKENKKSEEKDRKEEKQKQESLYHQIEKLKERRKEIKGYKMNNDKKDKLLQKVNSSIAKLYSRYDLLSDTMYDIKNERNIMIGIFQEVFNGIKIENKQEKKKKFLEIIFNECPEIENSILYITEQKIVEDDTNWIDIWKKNSKISLNKIQYINQFLNTSEDKINELKNKISGKNQDIEIVSSGKNKNIIIGEAITISKEDVIEELNKYYVYYINIMSNLKEKEKEKTFEILFQYDRLLRNQEVYDLLLSSLIHNDEETFKKVFNIFFIKEIIYNTLDPFYTLTENNEKDMIILLNANKNNNGLLHLQNRITDLLNQDSYSIDKDQKIKDIKDLNEEYHGNLLNSLDKNEKEKYYKSYLKKRYEIDDKYQEVITTKNIFKKQKIGELKFIMGKNNDIIFKKPSILKKIDKRMLASETYVEYWRPKLYMQKNVPVFEEKDEIKNILTKNKNNIYVKLSYVPIMNNDGKMETVYYMRKFVDFNDFLMAWFETYSENMNINISGKKFYQKKIKDIKNYFKEECEKIKDDEEKQKLNQYIKTINKFIRISNMYKDVDFSV